MDEQQLRQESQEIEQLLVELHDQVTQPAWRLVETIVGRVVRLYGAGLAHAIAHARAAGADGQRLAEHMSSDDLLSSLLILHGLHPMSTEERVRHAIAAVDQGVELASIDGSRASLRAKTPKIREADIRRAIGIAAPEVDAIEFTLAA